MIPTSRMLPLARRSAASAVVLTVCGVLAVPGAAAVAQPLLGTNTSRVAAAQADTWVPVGPMSDARSGATQTLLNDGQVLVAGGGTARAELYDPKTESFTPTGSMS